MSSSTNVSFELTSQDTLRQPDITAFLRSLDVSHGMASKNSGTEKDPDIQIENEVIFEQSQAPLDDSELHFDADKGDVIFDYGTQEIVGTPDNIGEHISQILESVLPSGMQKEAQGKLKAMVAQNHVVETDRESFVDLHDAMNNLQRIQKVRQVRQRQKNTGKLSGVLGTDRGLIPEDATMQEQRPGLHIPSNTFRNYGESPSRPPNFSVLISEKRPVCLFCEYHMVFGEPPRNMIKWYNRMERYENLPRDGEEDRKAKHSRKRNR